jgi:hypothetical protein
MGQVRREAPFPLPGVAQVCIVVPDLDRAVQQFWSVFRVGPWHIYTYGKPMVTRMTRHGKPTDYRMRVALGHIGDMRIELIQPLEGETVYSEFVKKHGYGVHHIGVLTDDMARSLQQAEAAGLHMTMEGAGFGLDGDGHYAYLDTEGLIGTTIELIERPRRRRPPESVYPPAVG